MVWHGMAWYPEEVLIYVTLGIRETQTQTQRRTHSRYCRSGRAVQRNYSRADDRHSTQSHNAHKNCWVNK